MIMTNKLLPVALVAALIGGSVGAFVMHSKSQTASDTTTQDSARNTTNAQYAQYQTGREQIIPAEFNTSAEQTAYKTGFADGYRAAELGVAGTVSGAQVYRPARVVYRNNAGRTVSQRRVYYDYNQPRGRSFWQKHRDKLTVAMGTGAGAILGGVIGGKKGAGIGALAGAGGSALYTYKLRNRHRRY
jgi:hypothetical protein